MKDQTGTEFSGFFAKKATKLRPCLVHEMALSGIVKLTFVIVIQVRFWYAYHNLIYRRDDDDKSCFF